jgi:alpha-tubulin suppressor-like RCC1 family protein
VTVETQILIVVPFSQLQVIFTRKSFFFLSFLKCFRWGSGYNYHVGDGGQTTRYSPVKLTVPGRVVSVTCSSYLKYALTSNGTVYAWGPGYGNGLGGPMKNGAHVPTLMYSDVNVTIAKITSNTKGMYAIGTDGIVYSTGVCASGECGQNLQSGSVQRFGPVYAVPTTGATDIAATTQSAFALVGGVVYAWGTNYNGELALTSSTSFRKYGAAVTGALASKTVVAIATGSYHVLVLTSDNLVYGWGMNGNNQLSLANTNNVYAPQLIDFTGTPLQGKTIAKIAAGSRSSMVLGAYIYSYLTKLVRL